MAGELLPLPLRQQLPLSHPPSQIWGAGEGPALPLAGPGCPWPSSGTKRGAGGVSARLVKDLTHSRGEMVLLRNWYFCTGCLFPLTKKHYQTKLFGCFQPQVLGFHLKCLEKELPVFLTSSVEEHV